MKTGTVVAIGIGLAGLATVTYVLIQQRKKQAATPGMPAPSPGIVDSVKEIFSSGKEAISALQPKLPVSDLEGKLIRVARNKVYLVQNNLLHYISKLPLADGRGWESVVEVGGTDLKEGTPYSAANSAASVYNSVYNYPDGANVAGLSQF